MPRPIKCRRVQGYPTADYFKPRGIPLSLLKETRLSIDGLESIRLADLKGLEQQAAAKIMGISRATFGRIVKQARKITADAIVNGKALKIEGGEVKMASQRKFTCAQCAHSWQLPYGTGRPQECPECQSRNIHRVESERGYALCGGARRGPCRQGRLLASKNKE